MAFKSLNEAAQAVGRHSAAGARYMQAADRLSAFFSQAQIQAEHHPKLQGAWMRGLDVERWEFWASATDGT